jgi:putative peptidoglycan lipid II flippase
VRIALVDFAVNVVLSLVLIRYLGLFGIVLANTAAIITQMVLLERALVRRMPELHLGPLLPSVGKILVGAAAMVGVVLAGLRGVAALGLRTHAADLVAVAGLIPAAVAAYGAILWMLRIEGRDEVQAVLAKVPVLGRLFRAAL